MSEPVDHPVQQGEDMPLIAERYGFFWQTLWNLSENAELKEKRKNPNVLLAGDVVHAPALRERSENAACEKRHRYRRLGVPSKIRLRLLREGEPRAGLKYTFDCGGKMHEGTTSPEGEVALPVPPGATRGTLTLVDGANTETQEIAIGALDPPETTAGVQQRLRNLHYGCEPTGAIDDLTTAAVRAFQEKQGLGITGEVDAATRDKLVEMHGS